MISKLYKLSEDGQTPVLCKDEAEFVDWIASEAHSARRVALTELPSKCMVSTVFLGDGSGNWETMIFKPYCWQDIDMDRCQGTREQAEAMHQKMVDKYGKLLYPPQGQEESYT